MKENRKTTVLVLFAVLLAAAPPAAAGLDAGPAVGRVWAEPGEQIGLENQFTQTLWLMDPYGSDAKIAEDWQLVDDFRFAGSLFRHDVAENGNWLTLKASGDNGGDSGGGYVGMWGGRPGDIGFGVVYKGFDHYYDRSIETPFPMFVEPAGLDFLPTLRRNQLTVDLKKNLGGAYAVRLDAGYEYTTQNGDKTLLAVDSGLPSLWARTSDTHRFWLGGSGSTGNLAANWNGDFQADGGYRYRGGQADLDHGFDVDAIAWSARAGARYDFSNKLRLLGNFGYANRSSNPTEVDGDDIYSLDGETSVHTVVGGLIYRPRRDLNLKLSGRYQTRDTDAWSKLQDEDYDSVDNDRNSTTVRADIGFNGLKDTRLAGTYRYLSTDQEELLAIQEVLSGPAIESQSSDRQQKTHEFTVKARRRLSPKASVRARFAYSTSDIDETVSGDDLRYWQGDRSEDRTRGRISLDTRPVHGVHLDAGYEMIRQTFQRDDIDGVETTWDSDRAFATASWLATAKVTVLGAVSMGKEDYAIDGFESEGGEQYEGTTWRFSPGMSYRPLADLELEGHYEGVRQRDSIDSDFDRWFFRANYRWNEMTTLAASYRRYEFDENRWDDAITDLYALSFTKRF